MSGVGSKVHVASTLDSAVVVMNESKLTVIINLRGILVAHWENSFWLIVVV